MKNKMFVIVFFVFNFILLFCCSKKVICLEFLKEKVYNVDVGNNMIVYEYDKNVNSKNIHYIGIYNKIDNTFVDIKSNDNEFIDSGMFFPSISNDDKYITFTSDATNITNDLNNKCFDILNYKYSYCSNIYIYDIETKKSVMIKNNYEYLNGNSYVSKISRNGRFVVFESTSTNNLNFNNNECVYDNENICINIYVYNILTQTIKLVSTNNNNYGGNSNSISPSISENGEYITFQTSSTNLLNNYNFNDCKYVDDNSEMLCSHIYLYDNNLSTLKLITKNNDQLFNDNSGNAIISDLGNIIIYESYATNIENKFNFKQHIVVYDISKGTNMILSKKDKILNNRDSYLADVSNDGKYVAIITNSTNLNERGIVGVYIYNTSNMKASLFNNIKEKVLIDINDDYIFCYDNSNLLYEKIDNESPVIEKNQYIYILKDSNILLNDKIKVSDNLCDDVKVVMKDNLVFNKIGEFDVLVVAIDSFENISSEYIKVIVLDKDIDAPVFTDINEIKVLKGSLQLNLSNYIEAVDLIDGSSKIYIINDGNLNLNTKGKYRIKLMSKDNSNNIAYKELDIIVYENYDFTYLYEILIIIGLLAVIIFSIIKVK